MSDPPYATCDWSPTDGYKSLTPHGEIRMFEEGGHRALELLLLSVAACLNYYLVQYAQARKLPIRHIHVACNAQMAEHPERISRITTKVVIHGALAAPACDKMVNICERACKVANTLKHRPQIAVVLEHHEEPPTVAGAAVATTTASTDRDLEEGIGKWEA